MRFNIWCIGNITGVILQVSYKRTYFAYDSITSCPRISRDTVTCSIISSRDSISFRWIRSTDESSWSSSSNIAWFSNIPISFDVFLNPHFLLAREWEEMSKLLTTNQKWFFINNPRHANFFIFFRRWVFNHLLEFHSFKMSFSILQFYPLWSLHP